MASKENVLRAILLGIFYTCRLARANYGAQEKSTSVVLKGKVFCHECSLNDIVSDSLVAVECNSNLNRKTSAILVSIEGETNEYGEFKVKLPSSIISYVLLSSSFSDDHNSTLKGFCSVRLLSSPQEKCNVPFPVTSSSDLLTLTSDCHGIFRTFTFPSLSYGPQSEVRKGSSNGMDASFPHANFPPLLKPKLGFSSPLPLPLPHPHLGFSPLPLPLPHSHPHPHPHLGFSPLHLPHPYHRPHLGFSPLHLPHPYHRPSLSFPPVPTSIPYPAPTLSPSVPS